MSDHSQLCKGSDAAHAAPEAAEYTPTLPDVLQQLELPAAEVLVDILTRFRCVKALRLTCRALRDLADASVRIPKMLTLQLRADGAVAEPLSALERWGRRGGISLLLQLPAEAAAGANALLPAAFAQLPEEARRRVTAIRLNAEEPSAASEDSDSDHSDFAVPERDPLGIKPFRVSTSEDSDSKGSDTEDSEGSDSEGSDSEGSDTEVGDSDGGEAEPGAPEDSDGGGSDRREAAAPLSGAAVAAMAASLPCLRKLDLSDLPSTWTPGANGEAYAALAALGTLEELELPGVPGLTGVEALEGSLRSLKLEERPSSQHKLTQAAAAPLGQLTRLEALNLNVPNVDLGEGPTLRSLLSLLPCSLKTLVWDYSEGGTFFTRPGGIFGISGRRVTSFSYECLMRISATFLAELARDELLPCLEPDGRLDSLNVTGLLLDKWGASERAPLTELCRRSDRVRIKKLHVSERRSAADVYSALTSLGPVENVSFSCGFARFQLDLSRAPQRPPPSCGSPPDLPPPEEVLRAALQRIAPPGVGPTGWAAAGRPESWAGTYCPLLLLRGPAAAAALALPSPEAVRAWARDLERRARAEAGPGLKEGRLIIAVQQLPSASAALLKIGKPDGAPEAVAAAVAAVGDGSEATHVGVPGSPYCFPVAPELGLTEVMREMLAASRGPAGGPSLQQLVEWAMAVLAHLSRVPRFVDTK